MIKLNEDYSFEKDPYQWILHSWKTVVNKKDGSTKRQKKTTFHSNILQVCNEIVNREAGKCESMEELRDLLIKTVPAFAADLEKVLEGKEDKYERSSEKESRMQKMC